jgi:hypothetical protein
MTPKIELEQHSLQDLLESQREVRGDIRRLDETVRVLVSGLAQGKHKPSGVDLNTARAWQAQLGELSTKNYQLAEQNYLLAEQNRLQGDRIRELSMDIDRLCREKVALQKKLEDADGDKQ